MVYDLQDESARTDEARPFPYLECVNPTEYAYSALAELTLPKVVYRCVAPLTADGLAGDLRRIDAAGGLSVLVGPASRAQAPGLKLADAYALRRDAAPDLPIGGVLIAERHQPS